MSYLLDTNIFLRTLVTDDPNYQITIEAIASLKKSGESLFVAPQNLIELWNDRDSSRRSELRGIQAPATPLTS